MEYTIVRYHSRRWDELVEQGWLTVEVIYGQGSTRWACMIKERGKR